MQRLHELCSEDILEWMMLRGLFIVVLDEANILYCIRGSGSSNVYPQSSDYRYSTCP